MLNFYQILEALVHRPEFDEKDVTADEAVRMLEEYLMRVPRPFKRADMPQIPLLNLQTGRFNQFLAAHKVPPPAEEAISVNELVPTQQDLSLVKVRRMMDGGYKDKPIIVARRADGTNFVIDGHHKWGALWCLSRMHPDRQGEWDHVSCLVIPGNVNTIINLLNQFWQDVQAAPEDKVDITLRQELITPELKQQMTTLADDFFADFGSPPKQAPLPNNEAPPQKKRVLFKKPESTIQQPSPQKKRVLFKKPMM